MDDLSRIRTNAVGLKMSQEELNLFHARKEEELDIPTREGTTHVYLYYPEEERERCPVFINLHGGGFVKGHREQDVVFSRNICQNAGCMVFGIDYKTAPEKKYPYALHETYDVVSYLYKNAEKWNLDREKFVMAGHSAGGNLIFGTAIMAGKTGEFTLAGLIADYPPVDLYKDPKDKRLADDPAIRPPVADARMYNDWYIDPERRKESTASMIYASQEELAALPPTLLITAEYDFLGEEGEAFAYRLLEAGVTVTAKRVMGADHGFTVRRKPGFEEAEKLIFNFLKLRYNG